MAMKCCIKLETAKERCPIVFQGHPSNFKVTRDKTSPILTQIGRFRTIGRSQLSNPSDLPCLRNGLPPAKSQSHYMRQSSFIRFLWIFFRPDNVYSSCPFVFLTATSNSINTPCLPVCLSVRHFVSALSGVILLGSWSHMVGLCVPWDNISADFAHGRCSSLSECSTS